MYQLREALTDPLTWAFFFYALVADIPNGTCIPPNLTDYRVLYDTSIKQG